MRGSTSTRPAIFAMSNPTNNGTAYPIFFILCGKNSMGLFWFADFWTRSAFLVLFFPLRQLNAPQKKHFPLLVTILYLQVEAHLKMLILVCTKQLFWIFSAILILWSIWLISGGGWNHNLDQLMYDSLELWNRCKKHRLYCHCMSDDMECVQMQHTSTICLMAILL